MRFKIFFTPVFCCSLLVALNSFSQSGNDTAKSATLKSRAAATPAMVETGNSDILNDLIREGKSTVLTHKSESDSIKQHLTDSLSNVLVSVKEDIAFKETTVAGLLAGNESIDEANTLMATNTILFFTVLSIIITLLILNRIRKLAATRKTHMHTSKVLEGLQLELENKTVIDGELRDVMLQMEQIDVEIKNAAPLLSTIVADKTHPVHKQARALIESPSYHLGMIESVLSPPGDEKIKTNLNELIRQVSDQAYFAVKARIPEFHCKLVKDLESILPQVEVYPEGIRFVLFNLFENAFGAVWKKRGNSPKGYEATVTVSTRKLPRFIQIRIKDNGTGFLSGDNEKLFKPFYTTNENSINPGLGLSESYQIITQRHKGELYLETDLSNSTDFIIRFPVQTIM